jgi:hypothetical protein
MLRDRGRAVAKIFVITHDGVPEQKGNKWFAHEASDEKPFIVGYTVPFTDGDGDHRGLSQTKVANQLPPLIYDRHQAEVTIGLWAHFAWPTIMGESAGRHLTVNTYDRARFTFGFYQLAAHTPNDNLILLFRQLLALPEAKDYFPDLTLRNGVVHQVLPNGSLASLETVTTVNRPNGKIEKQILGFMNYLNPDTANAGEREVLNAAKLMHWLMNYQSAVDASVRVSIEIMRRKVKSAAKKFGLAGQRPELAIWVSDIIHQSRGGPETIRAALKAGTFEKKLDALFEIASPDYESRRKLVRKNIETLITENRFAGVSLGDPKLPLD